MIKTIRKLVIEGMYFNIVKAIYGKSTINIIINSEKLKPLPLKSDVIQGCQIKLVVEYFTIFEK
jgi:hypothetical protein